MQEITRRGYSNYLNGIDAEILNQEQVEKKIPHMNMHGRYPVLGALLQRRAGTARHDAVAWGYARALAYPQATASCLAVPARL